MTEEITQKQVTLVREAEGVYVARNPDGAEYRFGYNVDGALSAVDLLLVAIAGCSATDLDMMTSRRAEPSKFEATVNADKVGGSSPAILRDIDVAFDVAFPEGPDGDKARARVQSALKSAEEKTCTVSRTVANSARVTLREV
ncbi:OsmC family protein [Demequina flava]|uniref:OsmC family protein n=1 Tax=Demequina flava TaxID=1095025 RepID=UPI000B2B7C87|nr:OsmC family protein [Demequina flava]